MYTLTEEEYKFALEEVERLISLNPTHDSYEANLLSFLTNQVEYYERVHFPILLKDVIEKALYDLSRFIDTVPAAEFITKRVEEYLKENENGKRL